MQSQETSASTIAQEKQIIQGVLGGIDLDAISLNDSGWDSRVYEIKPYNYFFKFPRSDKIRRRYAHELEALRTANSLASNVHIPELLWVGERHTYFGYQGITGKPLRHILSELGKDQKQSIGKDIGEFLRLLHASKSAGLRVVSPQDEANQIQRWYTDNQREIAGLFTPAETTRLEKLVHETWPQQLLSLGSDPVLSHGDFHFENILFDTKEGVGIIDFGDAACYDRSKDFLELGEDLLMYESVLQSYGATPENLQEKIAIRKNMIQVINLGFYIGKKNTLGIQKTAETIRSFL